MDETSFAIIQSCSAAGRNSSAEARVLAINISSQPSYLRYLVARILSVTAFFNLVVAVSVPLASLSSTLTGSLQSRRALRLYMRFCSFLRVSAPEHVRERSCL